MRFLVDAQLPPALARWLEDQGHQAQHVVDLGLGSAGDRIVWERARETGAAILTKDEDFVIMSMREPEGPPVVWLRLGNTTRRVLLVQFSTLLPRIEQALSAGERVIEVAPVVPPLDRASQP